MKAIIESPSLGHCWSITAQTTSKTLANAEAPMNLSGIITIIPHETHRLLTCFWAIFWQCRFSGFGLFGEGNEEELWRLPQHQNRSVSAYHSKREPFMVQFIMAEPISRTAIQQPILVLCRPAMCKCAYLLQCISNTYGTFTLIRKYAQSDKNLRSLKRAFPAEAEQGDPLPSCVSFHPINKCPFHGPSSATFFTFLRFVFLLLQVTPPAPSTLLKCRLSKPKKTVEHPTEKMRGLGKLCSSMSYSNGAWVQCEWINQIYSIRCLEVEAHTEQGYELIGWWKCCDQALTGTQFPWGQWFRVH